MEEVDRRIRPVQMPLGHQSFSSAGSTTPTHGGSVSGSSSQPSTYEAMLKNVEAKKRKTVTTKGSLDRVFQNEVRENLNSYIVRMFYSGGLSFHFARNPYYLKVISYAANNNLGVYIPPGYNSLRTTGPGYDILISRWSKSSLLLHCLTHSLNSRYYSKDWLDKESNRVTPHKDEEISDERNKCMRRFFPDREEHKKANLEFARFSGATDSFGSFDSLNDRGTFDARSWWMIYGSSAPMLQNIALKFLCQPCSSSCVERNWSTYSFIHSVRRNRIVAEREKDLVYVYTNLCLLSRKQEQYNEGESRLWDVYGDAFDPLDGAGELEIASLSLDEPELENVLFTDDINED